MASPRTPRASGAVLFQDLPIQDLPIQDLPANICLVFLDHHYGK
jgi:hypothetical protein